MSDRRVFVSEEVVTVWEFTVDEFIETYQDEWVWDGQPDREEWVRQSIEELGADQLDRVSMGQIDDTDLRVTFK